MQKFYVTKTIEYEVTAKDEEDLWWRLNGPMPEGVEIVSTYSKLRKTCIACDHGPFMPGHWHQENCDFYDSFGS